MKKIADNIVEIKDTDANDQKKFVKVKEGSDFKAGDYVHILDTSYAEVSDKSILLKHRTSGAVLRKK
jgi:hypothetical protein